MDSTLTATQVGAGSHRPRPAPAGRFFAKVEFTETCWFWTGAQNNSGYGVFWYGQQPVRSHRWIYAFCVSPIPTHLQVDHLCRVRYCVNPDHMALVTSAENTRRGLRAQQTHCLYGHSFSPENTYYRPDRPHSRECRVCLRRRDRGRRNKNKWKDKKLQEIGPERPLSGSPTLGSSRVGPGSDGDAVGYGRRCGA